MQNVSNLWESAICNEYALQYAEYAKYVNKNTMRRICTPHFASGIVNHITGIGYLVRTGSELVRTNTYSVQTSTGNVK